MNGLILAGGHSSRMGQPKSLLSYHGKPQYQYAAALLSTHCERVFISCRKDQSGWFEGYETILDSEHYGDIGLINGVLSAFDRPLSESWFILGCDYPLIQSSDLEQLLASRNPNRVATVFYQQETQIIEPLVGIYEASAGPLLKNWVETGHESLRRFLETQEVQLVVPQHSERLKSVDTPEEMKWIVRQYQSINTASNIMESIATKQTLIQQYKGGIHQAMSDLLAVEEPLEITLQYGPITKRKTRNISITMRTPGADEDLAIGFLFTEGIVQQVSDVFSARVWGDNMVMVSLRSSIDFDLKKLERHFYTSSSCGVCGKASMDAVKLVAQHSLSGVKKDWQIDPELLYSLPERLRKMQATFDATGGLHACAIFDLAGNLLTLREDVGRHNALDKLIGHYLQQNLIPLDEHILLLSGRASFELLQKSAMAGIRFVCAVGAPSSLAVETAESFGITLIGFLREGRFNVYCGAERLIGGGTIKPGQ